MAKNSIRDYSTSAAGNTDIGGIGIQGTNLPSNFDNAFREIMKQLADWNAGAQPITDSARFCDPVDNTKQVRLDAGNVAAGTTRILFMPDADVTISSFSATLLDDTSASAWRVTLGLGTSATVNTGTSGATIPLLNGANTWSGVQAFSATTQAYIVLSETSTKNFYLVNESNAFTIRQTSLAGANIVFTCSDVGAVNVPAGGQFTVAGGAGTGVNGATIADGGRSFSRNGTTSQTQLSLINGNGTVGSISTSGTTTAYNTTSDETLKDFIGPYDPQKAIAVIKADPVRDFTWKGTGEYAVGWGAQTSYAVSKDLASPGEGDQPWGVDQSKRAPYLWAALSWALDKIDELEARLSVVEGA